MRYVDVSIYEYGNHKTITLDQNRFRTQILNSRQNIVDVYNKHFNLDETTRKYRYQQEMYSLARDNHVRGNVFSLSGTAIVKDNKLWEWIITSEEDNIIIAEYNTIQYKRIIEVLQGVPEINRRVIAINADYFIAYRIFQNNYGHIKLGYIDLDLCISAHSMVKHYGLIEKINHIVTSDQVADIFCLSLTYSRRSGRAGMIQKEYSERRIEEELKYNISRSYPGIKLVDDYRNPYTQQYGAPNSHDPNEKGGCMKTMAYVFDKTNWTRKIVE